MSSSFYVWCTCARSKKELGTEGGSNVRAWRWFIPFHLSNAFSLFVLACNITVYKEDARYFYAAPRAFVSLAALLDDVAYFDELFCSTSIPARTHTHQKSSSKWKWHGITMSPFTYGAQINAAHIHAYSFADICAIYVLYTGKVDYSMPNVMEL
jgi:hypothetical protein